MIHIIRFKQAVTAFIAIAIAAAGLSALNVTQAQAATPLSSVQSGDLIRGQAFSAVYYYGADGLRYVFPNSKTYFTWYSNFDTVKFLSDADLGTIQIGGNVTYKPGVTMLKIDSDLKTYAVDANGTLRHVSSEAIAINLYGSTWNQNVHDIPDSFFGNYRIGSPISSDADFNPSVATATATGINVDKGLIAPAEINIGASGYNPIDAHITTGKTIRFNNTDSIPHSATGDDLTWGSGTIQPGGSFVATFKKAGTFTFFDSYKSQNTGAIYVQ